MGTPGHRNTSKNRGVFCHVTHDEIAFSEVHFSDLQPCSFSGYLKPLFTRSEDISSMLYVIKFSRIFGVFWQPFQEFPRPARNFVILKVEKSLGTRLDLT